jgi:hypothetical protein
MTNVEELYPEDTFGPGNSAYLSPIELLWNLVKLKLQEETYRSMGEMKIKFLAILNTVPQSLLELLCKSFVRKNQDVIKYDGRLDTELLKESKRHRLL